MGKKVLVSLVVLSLVIGGVTVLQSMGGEQTKIKDVKVAKTKSTDSSQKVIQYSDIQKDQKALKKINTSDWKSYRDSLGYSDIRYPSDWEISEFSTYPEMRKTNVNISYLPLGENSFFKTKEGVIVAISYSDSEISIRSEITIEEIEELRKSSPDRAFSIGHFKCIRKTLKNSDIEIRGYAKSNKEIFISTVIIRDPFGRGFENYSNQILASFITLTSSIQPEKFEESVIQPKISTATKKIDTSDWKTWYWECGDFEIKYPPDWKISKIYSDRLGCSGELSYGSLRTNDGARIHFNYSTTSAESLTTIEDIEAKIKKFPEKLLSLSVLKGIQEIGKLPDGIEIEMGFSPKHNVGMDERIAGGIYYVGAHIRDPFNKGYKEQVKQILSTFKIRSAK